MKQEVLERFCSKYAITANDAAHLLERMTLVYYPRDSFLVREGECNSHFYIIASGIWRGSFVNDDGTDQSLWFASAGEAVFSIWGYAGRRKEGVSKCMLICILMHFLHFYEKRPVLSQARAFVIS